MKVINTELFPFPHYYSNEQLDGSVLSWPSRCKTCKQCFCKKTKEETIQLCSYGYNYIRVNKFIVIGGVVIRDFPGFNTARRKVYNESKEKLITKKNVLEIC